MNKPIQVRNPNLVEYEESVMREVALASERMLFEELAVLKKLMESAWIEELRRTKCMINMIVDLESHERTLLQESSFSSLNDVMNTFFYIQANFIQIQEKGNIGQESPRRPYVFVPPTALMPFPPKYEAMTIDTNHSIAYFTASGGKGTIGVTQIRLLSHASRVAFRHTRRPADGTTPLTGKWGHIVAVAVGRGSVARVAIPTKAGSSAEYCVECDVEGKVLKIFDSDGDEVGRDGQWGQAAAEADSGTFVLTVHLSAPGDQIELIV
eukprot:PhF_6_TR13530/c0_g1_i1/m.21626